MVVDCGWELMDGGKQGGGFTVTVAVELFAEPQVFRARTQ